jgi:hypothetical protein
VIEPPFSYYIFNGAAIDQSLNICNVEQMAKISQTRALLQKPSVTQEQNMWMTENSVIHV